MTNKANATVTFIKGFHFKGQNHDGLGVDMDSIIAGDSAAGASPMEMFLQAMGGCTGMDVVHILRKRRIEPEKFELKIEGIKRDTHPKMYKQINIIYRGKGEGLTVNELERAVKLSHTKNCSISIALRETAEISWKCELME